MTDTPPTWIRSQPLAADSRHDSHQGNQDLAILKAVLVEVHLPPAFLSLPGYAGMERPENDPCLRRLEQGSFRVLAKRQSSEGAVDCGHRTNAL
jgi:hypothetical protein